MPSYDVFFFGALFFLIGVFLASFGAGVWVLIVTFAAAAVFLIFAFLKKRKSTPGNSTGLTADKPSESKGYVYFFWLAALLSFVLVGAVYCTWDDIRFHESIEMPFGERTVFSGVIVSNPVLKSGSQEFKLGLGAPYRGNILVKTARYPEFSYGEELKIEGKIEAPFSESYGRYLAKERVGGVVTFAKAEKIGEGKASRIKKILFSLKGEVNRSFQKVLPPKEAALLSGLTLGERGEFSEEFKEAMSKSGTTHLVALSGYNITIIAETVMALLGWFLIRRRLSFVVTVSVIIAFVVMTGAEASVVRAAIMGFLLLLARESGKFFDFRNAITLAGLVMVFHNPKVLVFDLGFQLSFLALLGIIYLRPAIIRFFGIGEEKGFLSWRDNLLTTAAAQLAVIPLILSVFGSFSLVSFASNVIVLELIPVTMGLGFITAAFSFLSYYLALFPALVVQVLLKFEILAIEFFSKTEAAFSFPFGLPVFLLYYFAIVVFIIYVNKNPRYARKTRNRLQGK